MAKTDIFEKVLASLIIMLSPMAPHFGSELWVAFCDYALDRKGYFDLVRNVTLKFFLMTVEYIFYIMDNLLISVLRFF